MTVAQITNLLIVLTLFEMMVTIGLGVTISEVARAGRDWRLIGRAALANYVCVPAITAGLLLLFGANAMVIAGFLIVAACPGAPYGPPFTAMARGNVPAAVGLMFILAGSSAIMAPLLLSVLLPLMAGGDQPLKINAPKIVMTLIASQLLPLCAGLALRHWNPALATRLMKPAKAISMLLNVAVIILILVAQFSTLLEIRARGWVGVGALLALSLAAGWLLGEKGRENRKTMAITTSVRNVAVGLVIATASFPGTAAVTAALAYGIFQTVAMALISLGWGRYASPKPA